MTVVLHDFVDTVAIGVEQPAHMAETVPLRGMLHIEQHGLV